MSGDIMGQEAEAGPLAEVAADVTQIADGHTKGWELRLSDRALVWGLGAGLSALSGTGGIFNLVIPSLQKGEVLAAVGWGVASLAALGLSAFAGKNAVGDLRQLEASEHHE